MVTQVNARAGAWLDGVAVAAQDMRLQVGSAFLTSATAAASTGIAAAQGVRPGQGSPLLSTWTSGMSFTLNAGTVWVQGTAAANAGIYTATLDTTSTLIVPNGDPTNPRIDSVIAVIADVGSSSSTDLFKILPGVPSGSPVHTALPANAVRLCDIAVAASASVLSAGNFTDLRGYAVAVGGILPVVTSAGTQNGPPGTYLDDLTTGRLKRLDGAGNARTPKIGAFTPVSTTVTGSTTVATGGFTATVGSISITTDGVTEVELFASHEGYQAATPAVGVAVSAFLTLDGTQVSNGLPCLWDSTDTHERGGGSIRAWVTPSAGTHTVALVIQQYGGGSTNVTMVNGAGVHAALIRAQPAVN